jgi:hypothetical protein
MNWVVDRLEKQRQAAEREVAAASKVLEIKEKFVNQLPRVWDLIVATIKDNVHQINAGGRQQLAVECTHTMVQVHPENEIGALAILEVDPTNGRLHYNCPVPAGQPGVPRIGELQIQVGTSQAHIMGRKHPNGPVVEFTPEEVSQFLLEAALFPKAAKL